MENSKLILLLRTFSSQELREFQRFVESPFFNSNQEIVVFYTTLRKEAPLFHSNRIGKERIFQKCYPKRTFSDAHCKFLMNQLLKLAERYISITNMEKRDSIRDYYLLDSYVNRGLDKNYQFIFKKTSKRLAASQFQDAQYLHQQYLLKDIANLYTDKQSKRQSNEYLQQMVDTFDEYYMANKLKYTCQMLNNQHIISESYTIHLAPEIIQFLRQNNYDHVPAIHLYHSLYLMLTEGQQHFEQVTQLFSNYQDIFEQSELRQVLYFLINFCIRQMKTGDTNNYYLNELFGLYQNGVNTGLLLDNEMINPWDYKNIIKIGLRLERFEETEKFILDYNTKLKEQFKEDAFHYNLAELYYYKNQPQKALEHLVEVEFSDIYYILGTKKLLLKIYFENEELIALKSLLTSFQTYLKRNKLISDHVRDTYMNFTKCLSKIIKQTNESLMEEIENTSPLTDKSWLLKCAEKY